MTRRPFPVRYFGALSQVLCFPPVRYPLSAVRYFGAPKIYPVSRYKPFEVLKKFPYLPANTVLSPEANPPRGVGSSRTRPTLSAVRCPWSFAPCSPQPAPLYAARESPLPPGAFCSTGQQHPLNPMVDSGQFVPNQDTGSEFSRGR